MFDLLIAGGTVVSDGECREADVAVEGDRVAQVGPAGTLGPARRTIDAAGQLVLPGGVDIHFHCRAPSHPERGDFRSETRAAAAGGVTTVFEMPISDPACSTPEVLAARRRVGERDSYVNFALYAGGGLADEAQAQALVDAGAIGFKIFTTAPPPHRLAEFAGLCAVREDEIYRALRAIKPTGRRVVFHAENQLLIDLFAGWSPNGVPARPPVVESTEIAIVGALARAVGTPVHIAHLTSREGLGAVRAVAETGAPLTAETCPQYLLFTQAEIDRWGAFAKIAPPLREVADTAALWEGLRDGSISAVASDHSPFRPEEKRDVDYAAAPPGLPSVEMLVPLLLDAGLTGTLPLEQAVELVTAAPARLFGLYPQKGTIAPGADADLILVEPNTQTEIRIDRLVTRAAGCAKVYDGMRLRGRILMTIVNGQVVYDHGVFSEARCGRFVCAERSASPRVA